MDTLYSDQDKHRSNDAIIHHSQAKKRSLNDDHLASMYALGQGIFDSISTMQKVQVSGIVPWILVDQDVALLYTDIHNQSRTHLT